jgi:membrane protein
MGSLLRRLAHFVWQVVVGLREHSALVAASAMAFNFFLSFIPALFLTGALVGFVVRKQGVAAVIDLKAAPPAIAEMVTGELTRLGEASLPSLAPLSVVGFLYLASTGTSSLMDVFELALRSKRRPWWKQRAIGLAWILGMISALSAAVVVVYAFDTWAFGGTDGVVLARPGARLFATVVFLGVGTSGLAVLYRIAVVHPKHVRRRVWPGAVVATTALVLVTYGFTAYVRSLADYALFYGSAAAVATLLIWLYLSSLALLVGAEVNAQLEGVRRRDSATSLAPP